jgi:hypothetical protein
MYLVNLAKCFAKDLILYDVGACKMICHQDDLMFLFWLTT